MLSISTLLSVQLMGNGRQKPSPDSGAASCVGGQLPTSGLPGLEPDTPAESFPISVRQRRAGEVVEVKSPLQSFLPCRASRKQMLSLQLQVKPLSLDSSISASTHFKSLYNKFLQVMKVYKLITYP